MDTPAAPAVLTEEPSTNEPSTNAPKAPRATAARGASRVLEAGELEPEAGRCAVALPVLVRDGLALCRCAHPAREGSALCELHLIHLRAS